MTVAELIIALAAVPPGTRIRLVTDGGLRWAELAAVTYDPVTNVVDLADPTVPRDGSR